ncbi:hypothetical protein GCM10023169_01750 [Georgenia halophila]|uniref:Gram-positive cocci surface proteins LPxTG domain-containing protein n=2 Tax=Georgenia halophila TaxID=620889 RepID=A0ABP8KSQ2_9MICO
MAEYADPDALVASDATPVEGEPFEIVIATDDFEEVTLTVSSEDEDVPDGAIEIAGTASETNEVEDGEATFTVTLDEAGTYELVATGPNGELIDSATIEVVAAGDEDAQDDGDDSGVGGLPETGASSTPLVIGAAVLLAAGAGAMVFARSRQTQA